MFDSLYHLSTSVGSDFSFCKTAIMAVFYAYYIGIYINHSSICISTLLFHSHNSDAAKRKIKMIHEVARCMKLPDRILVLLQKEFLFYLMAISASKPPASSVRCQKTPADPLGTTSAFSYSSCRMTTIFSRKAQMTLTFLCFGQQSGKFSKTVSLFAFPFVFEWKRGHLIQTVAFVLTDLPIELMNLMQQRIHWSQSRKICASYVWLVAPYGHQLLSYRVWFPCTWYSNSNNGVIIDLNLRPGSALRTRETNLFFSIYIYHSFFM